MGNRIFLKGIILAYSNTYLKAANWGEEGDDQKIRARLSKLGDLKAPFIRAETRWRGKTPSFPSGKT